MFRNLLLGSLLAPLGAALPLVVVVLVLGLVGSVLTLSPLAFMMAVGQSFYALFGAYFFGWIAALLIGAGNGVVWLLTTRLSTRVLLALPVGLLAVLCSFGAILFGTSGLGAWPTLALFCVQGMIGSAFSAGVIASAGLDTYRPVSA
jgi:hypothetical protein